MQRDIYVVMNDFHTVPTPIDRAPVPSPQNQQRNVRVVLSYTTGHADLTDSYLQNFVDILFNNCTFFSAAPGIFSKTESILSHNARLKHYRG